MSNGCMLEWTLNQGRHIVTALYLGHVCGETEHGMENDVMLGRMIGESRRGRPRTRWLDTL